MNQARTHNYGDRKEKNIYIDICAKLNRSIRRLTETVQRVSTVNEINMVTSVLCGVKGSAPDHVRSFFPRRKKGIRIHRRSSSKIPRVGGQNGEGNERG